MLVQLWGATALKSSVNFLNIIILLCNFMEVVLIFSIVDLVQQLKRENAKSCLLLSIMFCLVSLIIQISYDVIDLLEIIKTEDLDYLHFARFWYCIIIIIYLVWISNIFSWEKIAKKLDKIRKNDVDGYKKTKINKRLKLE